MPRRTAQKRNQVTGAKRRHMNAGAAKIERQREVGATLLWRRVESARRVAMVLETRQT